jgi:hypothetical protein
MVTLSFEVFTIDVDVILSRLPVLLSMFVRGLA